MKATSAKVSISDVRENVDHLIAAVEGLRLAVDAAREGDPSDVNWSALVGLVDIAEASCSPLLELSGNLFYAQERQARAQTVLVAFPVGQESQFRQHLNAMRGSSQ